MSLLLLLALQTSPAQAGEVLLSGFLVEGSRDDGAEQCVWITNTKSEAVDLSDWSLSDCLGPGGGPAGRRGKGGRRDLAFPSGTQLGPGETLSVARDGAAYQVLFGEPPDFEVGDPHDAPEIPDMVRVGKPGDFWVMSSDDGGVLGLFKPPYRGGVPHVEDVAVWDFLRKGEVLNLQKELRSFEGRHHLRKGSLWRGAPIDPWSNLASPYPPKTRVFVRDEDNSGVLVPDTDSWRDWDASSSLMKLGRNPGHRMVMAGQSRFLARPVEEEASFVMTSSPDNNFQGVLDAWAGARREILVSVYYFKHIEMAEALVAAIHRGVDVTLYMEGGVVGVKGGIHDQERYVARMIEEAGRERSGNPKDGLGRAYWLISDNDRGITDRYQFDHSKYTIIDREAIIVGSENYGLTGHPPDSRYGNRGWEIQVHPSPGHPPPAVVQHLLEVWQDDMDPDHHRDVQRYSDDPAGLDEEGRGRYGPPPPGFRPSDHPVEGTHVAAYTRPQRAAPQRARMELVMSPDTSLNEESAVLGAIARAKEELLVQHLDLRLFWGSGRMKEVERGVSTTPDLLLAAIVEAARRGVRVRVLLDCSDFSCRCGTGRTQAKEDSNVNTVAWLREVAAEEGLDLEARLLDIKGEGERDDFESAGLSKIHNKGMVVDQETVLFSSINGSENSFKGNREIGLLVSSAEVARYYQRLFWYDWSTVLDPERVSQGASRAPDRVSATLTGLTPRKTYYARVTALDSDHTDRDCVDTGIALGPHESAFSEELTVRADARGALTLSWDANRSESHEGDLAGYRVYFDDEPHPRLPDADSAKGAYDGRAREGSSPVFVDRGGR
ncbi:MAG: hypothetical protein JXX28_01440 [Deltaproteobacteria bacterium]|nr:hypothetical protein [Deltaproteobacteria bacterium]